MIYFSKKFLLSTYTPQLSKKDRNYAVKRLLAFLYYV